MTADPEMVKRWAERFLSLPERKLMCVQNIGLMVAEKLSNIDPPLAKNLFAHLAGKRTFVNVLIRTVRVPLESKCIWNSADNEEMNVLRKERLDCAPTDHSIALEVISALTFGKSLFLEKYVDDRIKGAKPLETARALMVLGFGLEDDSTEKTLAQFSKSKGLIGVAAKAARYAYERNFWSRHWFRQMCETSSREDFWRFSILFLKIVDGRYSLWEDKIKRSGDPISRFEPSIQSKLKNRIKEWHTKRENTLFGSKAPPPGFVALAEAQ